MKLWTVAAAIVFGTTSALAQSHLDSDVPKYDFEAKYQNNLQIVLHDAYTDDVIARMIGEPSFFAEYAVGLKKTATGVSIFGLRTKIQVWAYESRDQARKDAHACDVAKHPDCVGYRQYVDSMPDDIHDIGVERCEVPVTEDVAAEIEDAWRLSLAKAGKGGDKREGLDGAFFYFAMNDSGRHLGGRVWSPGADTQPGKLVTLALDMKNLCEGKKDITLSKIATEASTLVAALKEDR